MNDTHFYTIDTMFNCWIEYVKTNHTNTKTYVQGLRDENFISIVYENYGILIYSNQESMFNFLFTDPNKKLLFDIKYSNV